ncbi:MAG TPA: trypsin-like peptidase domain-containing protein [Mycobacteriales bacterium]|jgi:putative serine protease PepD|nr:trypsin-like peptidase domain-containing protein [Mycobacteriales bacterium]
MSETPEQPPRPEHDPQDWAAQPPPAEPEPEQSSSWPFAEQTGNTPSTGQTPSPWARDEGVPSGQPGPYSQPGPGYGGYGGYGAYQTGAYPAQNPQQPYVFGQQQTAEPRRRRGGPVAAVAVLVAAIVGGGAGAAIEHHWGNNDKTVVSSLAAPPVKNTSADKAPDGSVQKVAKQLLPSVVSITVSQSDGSGDEGTGIILSSDGEILTNNHVVEAAANGQGSISITFSDGKTVNGSILGRDTVTDLAVIKAKGIDNAQPAQLGSSGSLQVGQPVVAIGSPLGLSGTVTTGIVSALNRPVNTGEPDTGSQDPNQQLPGNGGGSSQAQQATVIDAIQTDAAINPGNSGGALVNMSGQVVGINQSIATAPSSGGSSSQSGSIGLGFAIPIDEARPIVKQLTSGQKATHAQIGVEVTSAADSNGVPIGAKLHSVQSGEAGAKAGLKANDVITKVDSREIDSDDALIAAVRSHRPGDTVTLTYTRSGTTHTTKVTLGSDS